MAIIETSSNRSCDVGEGWKIVVKRVDGSAEMLDGRSMVLVNRLSFGSGKEEEKDLFQITCKSC
jgi:hypothetical protein